MPIHGAMQELETALSTAEPHTGEDVEGSITVVLTTIGAIAIQVGSKIP